MAADDERLNTSRLVLRRFRDDDVGPLAEMNADPEVMRFIGTGRMIERAETAAMICGVGYLSFAPRASDVA